MRPDRRAGGGEKCERPSAAPCGTREMEDHYPDRKADPHDKR